MRLFRLIFTWWHGQTFGTLLTTLWRGGLVGTDTQGNRYYEDKYGASINGKTRRWVVYNGDVEASRVPPEWHGWLHYSTDVPPVEARIERRDWHKPHRVNLTGTQHAYRPMQAQQEAIRNEGYQAWNPNPNE